MCLPLPLPTPGPPGRPPASAASRVGFPPLVPPLVPGPFCGTRWRYAVPPGSCGSSVRDRPPARALIPRGSPSCPTFSYGYLGALACILRTSLCAKRARNSASHSLHSPSGPRRAPQISASQVRHASSLGSSRPCLHSPVPPPHRALNEATGALRASASPSDICPRHILGLCFCCSPRALPPACLGVIGIVPNAPCSRPVRQGVSIRASPGHRGQAAKRFPATEGTLSSAASRWGSQPAASISFTIGRSPTPLVATAPAYPRATSYVPGG